jgi:hypothetical protein
VKRKKMMAFDDKFVSSKSEKSMRKNSSFDDCLTYVKFALFIICLEEKEGFLISLKFELARE